MRAVFVLLLVLFPTVRGEVETDLTFEPDSTATLWVVTTHARWWNSTGEILLWVPPGSDLVLVEVQGSSSLNWTFKDPERILLRAGPEGEALVRSLFRGSTLPSRALLPPGPFVLRVRPPEGEKPPAGWEVVEGEWILRGISDGGGIALPSLPPPSLHPLLLSLVSFSALTLLLGAPYSRRKIPLTKGDAPLLVHLRELQRRATLVLLPFGLFNLVYFALGVHVVETPQGPLPEFRLDTTDSLAAESLRLLSFYVVPEGVLLVVVRPFEAVMAEVYVSFFLSVLTVLPLLIYESARFLGPALFESERRILLKSLPIVGGLFLLGCAFGGVVLLPLILQTLYSYSEPLGAVRFLSLGDLVSFSFLTVLLFGAAFELPVVMGALTRLGVVRSSTWSSGWRYAVVLLFLFAGIVTPDPSIVSQLLVGVPLVLLYFMGIFLSRILERRKEASR